MYDVGKLHQTKDWLPDLFAHLWSELVPKIQEICSIPWHGRRCDEARYIVEILRRLPSPGTPPEIYDYLTGGNPQAFGAINTPEDFHPRAFVVAQCIDEACEQIHPRMRNVNDKLSEGMKKIYDHYLSNGSYSRKLDDMLVLPRPPIFRGGDHRVTGGDRLDDQFGFLLVHLGLSGRIPFRTYVKRLPGRDDFEASESGEPLKIAIVPLAEDADDLVFTSGVRNERPFVDIKLSSESEDRLKRRIRNIVRELEDKKVQVAVFPELTMSPAIQDVLASEMRKIAGDAKRERVCLRLIVAGSGLSKEKNVASGLPYNECIVFGVQGKELWRQCKLNHYKMSAKLLGDCKITLAAPGKAHSENIHTGDVIEIVDGQMGRMVVLICEDLNQERTSNEICDSFLPDWVFSPVLDEELEEGRWEVQRGFDLAMRFQTRAIVANSMVMPLRKGHQKDAMCIGLCVAPTRRRKLLHVSTNEVEIDGNKQCARMAITSWEPSSWDKIKMTTEKQEA